MVSIQVQPLQDGLSFGARIAGVTQEALADEAIRRQIFEVFENRGMIVFENVEPTAEVQLALSNVFGPLKDHPVKEVERSDQKKMPGTITIRDAGSVEIDGQELTTWQPWHFDHSYNNELNRAGVLRAEAIPPEGGITAFADGIQIYRDMPRPLRDRIEDLTVIYTLDLRYSQQRWGLPKTFREIRVYGEYLVEPANAIPRALHPVVWTRKTGEKVIHMSPYGARGFVGMENAEGDALFGEVWEAVERTIEPYEHRWELTDMLVWDNWRMLHAAHGCDPKYPRVMHRTTIKGDYGFGRWETEPKHVADTDAMG